MNNGNNISDDDRTTGMGLWTDSKQMLSAAKLVLANPGMSTSSPVYYLICHGIEVGLKAFLRAKGLTLSELRNIGHNLDHALGTAITLGFEDLCPLSAQDKIIIGHVNNYYKAKHFEYRVTGYVTLSPPEVLLDVAERILKSVAIAVRP